MDNNIEEQVVNKIQDDKSEKLVKLLKDKGISNGVIMLTMFGIGSHTEYYNVLYNRINNIKEEITDDVVKKEVIEIFHEIDRNEDKEEDEE